MSAETNIILFLAAINAITVFLCRPYLLKAEFPKIQKLVVWIFLVSVFLFSVILSLDLSGYELKGDYTFSILSGITLLAIATFFIRVKNFKRKIVVFLVTLPLILIIILSNVFGHKLSQTPIDENHKLIVFSGGFMACPTHFYIVESQFGIFDKRLKKIDGICFSEIKKVELIDKNAKTVDFLVYHGGEYEMENPHRLQVERNSEW